MELTNLGSSLQDFKGILSNTSTTFENQNHYTYHGDQSSDLVILSFIYLLSFIYYRLFNYLFYRV